MFDLDIRPAALVLLLACLPTRLLAKSDLEAELLRAGFVPGAQALMCAESLYVAKVVNGNLEVRPADANAAKASRAQALRFLGQSVRYEAQNNGEFGGKLEAILPSGERRLILQGNVQALLPLGADLFIFEGLAHLSMTTGAMYRLADYERDPKALREPVTFLPDTPVFVTRQTSALNGAEFWIVGTRSLVSVRVDQRALDIYSWNAFKVSEVASFLQDQRGVLIGTCGGVVAIERRCLWSREQSCAARFYVPKR